MENQNLSVARLFSRRSIPRLLGVLVAVPILLLAFPASAVPALDADAPAASDAPGLASLPIADPAPQQAETPPASPAAARSSGSEVPTDAPLHQTGDRLDAEEVAAFQAHIEALKERGAHRGAAVYTSW